MDKEKIEQLLSAIDNDLMALHDNLTADSKDARPGVLKTTVQISLAYLETNRERIAEIRNLLSQN